MATIEVLEKAPETNENAEPSAYELQNLQKLDLELMDEDMELLEKEEEENEQDDYKVNTFSQYLKQIGKYPLLTPEQEIDVAKAVKNGSEEAKETLLMSNLRLVVSIAKRYSSSSDELMDLVEEGTIGLMRAIERFDYTMGFKFSTYATYWIRQAMTRYLFNSKRTIRIPVHMEEKIFAVNRSFKKLAQQNGYDPDPEEIAEDTGLDKKTVRQAMGYDKRIVSLNIKVGDENSESTLEDFISSNRDNDSDNPEAMAIKDSLASDLDKCMEVLSDKEKDVLIKRYGLSGGSPMTLERISQDYNLTRERIRQIENKAMKKLKKKCAKEQMRAYLEN